RGARGTEGVREDRAGGLGGVRHVISSGAGVLVEPGLVALPSLPEVVPRREPGPLLVSDLLVDAGQQHVLMGSARLAAAGPHGDAPSGASSSNGWSAPSCRSSLRRTRYRWTLTAFSAMPSTAAISASFRSRPQRMNAATCCWPGRPWMTCQHRSSAMDDSACSSGPAEG